MGWAVNNAKQTQSQIDKNCNYVMSFKLFEGFIKMTPSLRNEKENEKQQQQ